MRQTSLAAVVITVLAVSPAAQTPSTSEDRRTQPSRFMAEDMLKVVTASVLDFSEDGRFVAFTERRPADNAETDHYRYGDPTLLAPAAVRLVVVNADTGARLLPRGDRLLNIRQASFSRDGRRLAVIVGSGSSSSEPGAMALQVWSTAGGAATPVALKTTNLIAANSSVDWTPDGSRVLLSMRTVAREREGHGKFTQITQGPIIVHSSKEPFLEWDELNRANRWRSLVEVDVTTGVVTQRLPERRVSSYRVARDGSFVVLQEDVTEKTDYETIGGTETRMQVWMTGVAEPRVFLTAKEL